LAKTVHFSRSAFGNIIANLACAKLTYGVLEDGLPAQRVNFGLNDTLVAARQRFARLSAWMMLNKMVNHIIFQVQIPFLIWTTLSEQKWTNSRKRRGPGIGKEGASSTTATGRQKTSVPVACGF
jgi:hypothetical protein